MFSRAAAAASRQLARRLTRPLLAAASAATPASCSGSTFRGALQLGGLRAICSSRPAPAPAGDDYHVPLKLNTLVPNPGAVSQKRRVGRGIGSGRGKTSKRGNKGTRARQGGSVPLGFEGGQTPLHRRLPKRGFKNGADTSFDIVSIDKVFEYVAMGRLRVPAPEPGAPPRMLTMKDLQDAGVIGRIKFGLKLVGGRRQTADGDAPMARAVPESAFAAPLHLEVSGASAGAIAAVEARGGTVTCAHFNRLALRALLKPHKFAPGLLPRRARPPPRLMARFLSGDKRGYLSPEVQLRNLRLFGRVTSEVRPAGEDEEEEAGAYGGGRESVVARQ